MRFLIVTSEVTFVRENYNQFLESLFSEEKEHIYALIVLKNNNYQMILKGLGLAAMGAPETGLNLINNSIQAKSKDHEKIARKYDIPTLYFNSANDPEFINYVKNNQIDLIVNARTRDIYKKKILNAPRLGCINIHHGLLPYYRGTMCDLYALSEGRDAGFSIHKMEKKIDDGDIIEVVPVTKKETKNKSFPEHIFQSSIIEGQTLAQLLKKIAEEDMVNFQAFDVDAQKIIYTKNPTPKEIKAIKKKGIKL